MNTKKQVSLGFFLILLGLGEVLCLVGRIQWAVGEDLLSSHSTVQLISPFRSLSLNTHTLPIGIQVHLEPGWHSYWKHPGDVGKPLTVRWRLPNYVRATSLYWPSPKKMVTDSWTSFIYDRSFLLLSYLSIDPLNKGEVRSHFTISADIKWFVCKKVCIPLEKTVSLSIPIRDRETINLTHKKTFEKWVENNSLNQNGENQKSVNRLDLLGRLWIFLLAFIGGLLLNFMPCVLPIVFLKFYNTIDQKNQNRLNVIGSNIVYSLGVIISFWVLAGLLVFLKRGGEWIGWGFQMQSVNFLISLAFLFTLVGLSFIGLVSAPFTSFYSSDSYLTKIKLPFLKNFLTGVLSVISASPCTAPFMGAVIGYALFQTKWDILFVFSFLGLGLSSPYLLLSVFPGFLRLVPSPGAWSEILKKWMVFPMGISVVWIVSLISRKQVELVFPLLLSIILLSMGFWLRHYLKNSYLIAWVIIILSIFYPFFVWNYPTKVESLHWSRFSISAMEQKRKEERPLLVNFTASWCLTCQLNEQWTFQNQKVIQRIKNKPIDLLKGDWTNQNIEITKTLSRYNRAGIPFYLYFPKGAKKGIILPALLTPSIFLKWTEK